MDLLNEHTNAIIDGILNENDGRSINKVFDAPNGTDGEIPRNALKVFLAGTIDNGDSEDWQHEICDIIKKKTDNRRPIVIFNPRRKDWPEADRKRAIGFQIRWELDHMDKADVIVMNIGGNSKSPISLMEIGIHCHDRKLIVFCPEDFWRYDNVRVVCERFGIPLHTTNNVNIIVREILNKL